MNLSQFSCQELTELLRGPGLYLCAGPFVFQVRSSIDAVAQGLIQLYGDFPLASAGVFADFHIQFSETRLWSLGYRPHVTVFVDGEQPSIPLPSDQLWAIFEGCLNWCIYTHAYRYLIIHAAAVERAGRSVIMPAPPGSGKSTLCAALVSRGWRLLTDELTLVDETGKIVPFARPISLKNESIDIIKRFAPEASFGPKSSNTIKGTIAHMKPPTAAVRQMDEPSRPRWLILPRYAAGKGTAWGGMSKGQTFMRVAESTVNYMALGRLGFDLVCGIIDNVDCYRFEYGDLDEAIRWFDRLESDEVEAVSA